MLYVCGRGCEVEVGMSKRPPSECVLHGSRFTYAKALGTKPRKPRTDRPRSSKSEQVARVPRWLTEGFAHGVDEREAATAVEGHDPYGCWLAQFDPLGKPCTDVLQRCHVISRQRVEKVVGEILRGACIEWSEFCEDMSDAERRTLVQLAAWDPRNARIGCTGHHPRFDSHSTPRLYVPFDALPEHVLEFAESWGLEQELERKCPASSPSTREAA